MERHEVWKTYYEVCMECMYGKAWSMQIMQQIFNFKQNLFMSKKCLLYYFIILIFTVNSFKPPEKVRKLPGVVMFSWSVETKYDK